MPLFLIAIPLLIASAAGVAQRKRGSSSRRGSRGGPRKLPGYDPTPRPLEALEAALRSAGSPARGSRATKKAPKPGTKAHAVDLARRFNAVDAQDVPDDLLVAMIVARDAPGDPVLYARTMLGAVSGNLRVLLRKPSLLGDLPGARFSAVSELRRRAMSRQSVKSITSAYEAVDAFRPHMDGGVEKLVALFIDRRNSVLAVRTLTVGNDAHTIVDPKQVLSAALELGAHGVILAHNHPSGDPKPSSADIEVTNRVTQAGRIVGIELLDHLVMVEGGLKWTSLREQGLMPARSAGSTLFSA